MTRQESGRPTPQDAASQVYTTFALLVQRGHALAEQRTTISHPDLQGKQLIIALKPLINASEASPYYKKKLTVEMFNDGNNYTGAPYMTAAGQHFDIWQPQDIGIFERESAAQFEALEMLREAKSIETQANLDPTIFTGAMDAAKKRIFQLQKWVASYNQYYDEPLENLLEDALQSISPESRQQLQEDVQRLNTLLIKYNIEEQ